MASYLEGELPLTKRALLDAHLDECDGCSREIAEMRGVIGLLRSLPEPEVPASLTGDVMRRIRAGEGRSSWLDELRSAFEFVLAPRVLAPVSAAMLGAGILLAGGQGRVILPEPQPTVVPRSGVAGHERPAADVAASRSVPPLELVGAPAAPAEGVRGADPRGLHREPPVVAPIGPTASELRDLLLLTDLMLQGSPSPYPAPERSVTPEALPVSRLRGETGAETATRGYPGTLTRSTSDRTSSHGGADARGLPSADEWLVILERNPAAFADQLAMQSLAEHELWVENLARRAVEQGRLEEVVTALRGSSSARARLLAADFAAAGERASASIGSEDRGSGSSD